MTTITMLYLVATTVLLLCYYIVRRSQRNPNEVCIDTTSTTEIRNDRKEA